jgi:hypothetical protein
VNTKYFPVIGLAVCISTHPGLAWDVEVSESIQCPFCGQSFEIVVDTSMGTNRFTTDCEICCRPMEVVAECVPGEILSLDVQAG